ncbi:radical SAM protein [Streptomyces sp. NPDC000348]|uniref:radical SAM protein n=1 Tax=Streptomyces sp. NPDC000348 TaxID=3364538 RepID=UPI003694BE02
MTIVTDRRRAPAVDNLPLDPHPIADSIDATLRTEPYIVFKHRALRSVGNQALVRVTKDRTLRVKVIDACGMTCTFCHNEGTPVSGDNHARTAGEFGAVGRSGRVSLYLATNGARFVAAPMFPDDAFRAALARLRDALGFEEVHLTGGEPTLHPKLAAIVAVAREEGYEVGVTSNGENGAGVLAACAKAGLGRVNFSIFGTTPEELAQVQNVRFRTASLAARKIEALERSIQVATDEGVGVSANVVIPDHSHIERVHRLLDRYSPQVSLRILSSLADGDKSLDAIDELLGGLGAVPREVHVIAGSSGFRISYTLPGGRVIKVKHIRPLRLPETCASCRFNNTTDCHEGYYGVRLYRDPRGTFHVGVCIQRMDLCLPIDEFLDSAVCSEISTMREQEFHALTAQTVT